jgi:hypothetical protein
MAVGGGLSIDIEAVLQSKEKQQHPQQQSFEHLLKEKNFTKKQRKKVASTLQYERLFREARFKKIFKGVIGGSDPAELKLTIRRKPIYRIYRVLVPPPFGYIF